MKVHAHLKPTSTLMNRLRLTKRRAVNVAGVRFAKVGKRYVATDIHEDKVDALRAAAAVQLEVIAESSAVPPVDPLKASELPSKDSDSAADLDDAVEKALLAELERDPAPVAKPRGRPKKV